jgi:hypothetical protein
MKLRSTLSLVLLLAVFFSACSSPSGGAPTTEVQTEAPAEDFGYPKDCRPPHHRYASNVRR